MCHMCCVICDGVMCDARRQGAAYKNPERCVDDAVGRLESYRPNDRHESLNGENLATLVECFVEESAAATGVDEAPQLFMDAALAVVVDTLLAPGMNPNGARCSNAAAVLSRCARSGKVKGQTHF